MSARKDKKFIAIGLCSPLSKKARPLQAILSHISVANDGLRELGRKWVARVRKAARIALIPSIVGPYACSTAHAKTPALVLIDTGICPSQVVKKDSPLAEAFISEKLNKLPGAGVVGAPFSRNMKNSELPVDDHDGHGTHLCGIVWRELLAKDAGMPPSLVMLKAGEKRMRAADLIAAVEEAARPRQGSLRVHVLLTAFNLYPEDCEAAEFASFEKALGDLMDRGVWVVASAGNRGLDLDRVTRNERSLPAGANHKNLLVIAAAGEEGLLASRSNYGKTSVWLAARGARVDSLSLDGQRKTLSGSSQAAALVAARLFALRRESPELSLSEAKKLLEKSSRLHPSLLQTTASGRFLAPAGHAKE